MSLGVRGAHLTIGTAGNRATVGIPGTGMYWTERLGQPIAAPTPPQPQLLPPTAAPNLGPIIWIAAMLLGLALLAAGIH